MAIQITVTGPGFFLGTEWEADLSDESKQELFGDFAAAILQRHGVDVFGLFPAGFVPEEGMGFGETVN